MGSFVNISHRACDPQPGMHQFMRLQRFVERLNHFHPSKGLFDTTYITKLGVTSKIGK